MLRLAVCFALMGLVAANEYYCPQNDDGCDWYLVMNEGDPFCYKIFNHGKSFENASKTCMALSIDDCQAELLPAFLVPQIFDDLDDPNECPHNLRIGAMKMNGIWVNGMGEGAEFPGLPWTPSESEPTDPTGDSAVVNFPDEKVYGFTAMEESVGFVCGSCAVEIPTCPEICDVCEDIEIDM